MEEKNNRIIYADLLRIIAIFAVIVIHVSASKWKVIPVNTFEWMAFTLHNSITRWCVPLFIMLSGMFFLNPEKEISVHLIFHKYILRLLVALCFWGLFYQLTDALYQWFSEHNSIYLKDFLYMFAKLVFGPPWYHLWYLYVMIGLYILTPIYREFIKVSNFYILKYFLILFFLFGLCLPFFQHFLLIYNSNYIINFDIPELIGYSGYFFAGYYLSRNNVAKKRRILIYVCGILSLLITFFFTLFISRKINSPETYFLGNLLPTRFFEACMIFLFVKQTYSKLNFTIKTQTILTRISKDTFGIYCIHDFIRKILSVIGLTSDFINPLLAIPIVSIVVFLISLVIIELIRQLKITKYLL